MKRWSLFLLLLAVAAFAVQPAAAQDTKHKVYVGIAQIMPMSSETIDGAKFEVQDEMGFGIGYEYRLNELMGLDFDLMMATHDVKGEGVKFAKIDFQPISASLNFHFFGKGMVDLYAGPTLSWVNWGDLEVESQYRWIFGGDKLSVDSEFTFGATFGVDIGNEKFAFTGGLRYLMLDASVEEVDMGVDPLLIRAGFAFKF